MTLLTITEASEFIRVTPRSIKNYMKKGIVPYMKIGGTVRIDREDLLTVMRVKTGVSDES